MKRRLLFVTSSRADIGKQLSLIEAASAAGHECHVFCCGMHYRADLGSTYLHVEEQCRLHGWRFIPAPLNHHNSLFGKQSEAGQRLAPFLEATPYDLVVIHGDRAEAMGAAGAAALANHRVAHIEGGEVTGTADESMRHCISKLAHVHLVANQRAKRRLIQLGERTDSIFVVGSPDLDLALSDSLPTLQDTAERYEIRAIREGREYGVLVYHPVTTLSLKEQAKLASNVARAVIQSERSYVMLGCNDDPGSDTVTAAMLPLHARPQIRYLPSMRFEHFLTLLRGCAVMVGNSSAGIREAPAYGVSTVNVGTRQNGREQGVESVLTVLGTSVDQIAASIRTQWGRRYEPNLEFGAGNSGGLFVEALAGKVLWRVPIQKGFITREVSGVAEYNLSKSEAGKRGAEAKWAKRKAVAAALLAKNGRAA